MNFLTRNKYWITLVWFLLVLIFFKFYNNFYFEDNTSIYFLSALLIIPVILIVISKITYHRNKHKYFNKTNNYFELVVKSYETELVDKLKNLTNVKCIHNSIYFGINFRGVILINSEYISLSILNTQVEYKYYYSNDFSYRTIYDKVGFQLQTPKLIFREILKDINNLVNKELHYEENKKLLIIKYVKLFDETNIYYLYKQKNKRYNITYEESFKL